MAVTVFSAASEPDSITPLQGATRAYLTYAELDADKATLPANSFARVTNDPTPANNWLWQWNGTVLTKSERDDLAQANAYADANRQFKPIKLGNVSLNTLTTVGIYFGTDAVPATLANNYPADGATGIIRVLQTSASGLIYHEFKGTNGTDYWRVYNGSTWSAWALNFDLSTYAKKSDTLIDLGVLVADVNLDTLTTAGRWALSSGTGIATTALNYPANGVSGVLEIIKNAASVVVVQRFTAAGSTTPIAYYRMLRSGTWSPWQTDKHAIPTGLLESGNLGTGNLNTFTTTGFYAQGTSGYATPENNYPTNVSGFLEVIKTVTSGLITQRYTSSSNKIYLRNGNISSFGAWVEVGGAGSMTNTSKIVSVMTNAINTDDLKTEYATYIVNSNILDLTLTNLPVQSYGILTVYKGSMTSFAMQSFLTNAGVVYARHWNGSIWSGWSVPSSGIRANLGCKHMKGLEKMSVVFQDKFANTPKNTTGESWQQTSTSCKPFQRVLNNSRLKQAHSAVPEKSRIPPN